MKNVFSIKAIKSNVKKGISLRDLHRRLDRLIIKIDALLKNTKSKKKYPIATNRTLHRHLKENPCRGFMKTKKYTLTQVDILALREATEYYWHEISKKVLKNKEISPVSKRMHEAVRDLYERFKQDTLLM